MSAGRQRGSAAAAPPAGERIRIAIVGLHFGGWMLEHEFAGPAAAWFEPVAICDRDAALTAQWAARCGLPGYTDLATLLEQVPCVVIGLFTGPVGRAALIRQIIDAGRDVITTKPFERSAAAAAQVLHDARARGRVVLSNLPAPHMSRDIAQIRRWCDEYALGRPIGYPAATWCVYHEQADGSWYDDPAQCPAAPIFRLGIYLLDDLAWFMAPVADVQLAQSRISTGRPTADTAALTLRHADGTIGTVFASFSIDDGQPYRCALQLHFAHGTITRNVGAIAAALPHQSAQLTRSARRAAQQHIASTTIDDTGAGYQWAAYAAALAGRQTPDDATIARFVAPLQLFERIVAAEAGR
jgi:predicted dehydrogenase